MTSSATLEKARNIHLRHPVGDLHNDWLLTHYLFGYDIAKKHVNRIPYSPLVNHTDIPRLLNAGFGVLGAGLVCSPLKFYENKRFFQIKSQLTYLKRICCENPNKIVHVSDSKNIEVDAINGKIIVVPGVEGSHSLHGNLALLDEYHDLGARYWTMAHFSGNEACNCPKGIYNTNEPGLTRFGEELVERLNDKNMLIDVAHTEREAFLQTAVRSENPVIVSHTGVKGIFDHWRNIDNEQIEAVAKTGGVIGIMIAPNYLGGSHFRPLKDVADHICHVIDIVGVDHVGYGTDLDGWIWTMPKGFSDVTDLYKITADLLERGLSEKDVVKIIGSNILRVVKAAFGDQEK